MRKSLIIRTGIYAIALLFIIVNTILVYNLLVYPGAVINIFEVNRVIVFVETILGIVGIFGMFYLIEMDLK